MDASKSSLLKSNGVNYLLPFILVTACFALWGFANDITNPMVKAFSKIFRMSVTEGAMVQLAFYGGYFAMAFPAAIFIPTTGRSIWRPSEAHSRLSTPPLSCPLSLLWW